MTNLAGITLDQLKAMLAQKPKPLRPKREPRPKPSIREIRDVRIKRIKANIAAYPNRGLWE